MMEVSVDPNGFEIRYSDILIKIIKIAKNRWMYDFYRLQPDSNVTMDTVCAPFEASGDPWIQSRYKDSIFTKCLMKVLLSEKEETAKLVQEIVGKIYSVSDEYIDLQNQLAGYDYKDTIDGIPKATVKYHIHPAMDFYDGKLYIGFRFLDDKYEKKEWIIDSDLKVWKKDELINVKKIAVKDKDIIGEIRWHDVNLIKRKQDKDPYSIFFMIKKKMLDHVWFSEPLSYDVLTLWIMGTYMYWAFDSYPYIHLSGTPDSGKSRVQRLSSCLTFNGYFTESISNSSLFRYVEDMKATLHIDEQEFLGSEGALETISILNSGYHKAGNATRQESITDKDGNKKFITRSFTTYSPKMLSGIRGLDKTLQTRSINIPMKPTTDKKYSRREINENHPSWQAIRDELYIWALKSFDDVMECYEEVKYEDIDIKNRMWQKYHVLITLAYYFNKIKPSSGIWDNVLNFIKKDQVQTITFEDFKIDLTYKALYKLCEKFPHPKNQYTLKAIREECMKLLGVQPPYEDLLNEPQFSFVKNIHVTLNSIGYKTIALTGNFRGVRVTKETLEKEALARGIKIRTPVITM